jgi:hypothetical protein
VTSQRSMCHSSYFVVSINFRAMVTHMGQLSLYNVGWLLAAIEHFIKTMLKEYSHKVSPDIF